MNNLEKKLKESAKEATSQGEAMLNDAKLLLASNAQEELNVLSSIGLDNDLKILADKKKDIIIRAKNGKALNRHIVHVDEITKLCMDYRLYMRQAKKYMGTIPPELGAELNRFVKKHNIPMPASSDYSLFYVIAPPRMFKGYKTGGQLFREVYTEVKHEVAEKRRLKREDPILVYMIPGTGSNYYAIVKSWGNDFTPIRRLYGLLTNRTMLKVINLAIILLGLYGLFKLDAWQTNQLYDLYEAGKDTEGNTDFRWLAWLLNAISIIPALIWMFEETLVKIRRGLINKIATKPLD